MSGECANPLLLGWLKEWMDEAQERNSKGYTVYRKAYQSMKACPLHFAHPTEAQQLNGLGPKLCDRLADKLKAYCTQNGLPMPEKAAPKNKKRTEDVENTGSGSAPAKKRKAPAYVPKLRSGAYALIMALATLDQDGVQSLSKVDLVEKAQPFSDSSFTTPSDPTKFYTAWKSMQTLESKELVCTRGHPTKRYCLSDEGWEVATRMKVAEGEADSSVGKNTNTQFKPAAGRVQANVHELSSPEPEEQPDRRLPKLIPIAQSHEVGIEGSSHMIAQIPVAEPIVLKSGTFDINLVLDTREIRTKNDRDYISLELKKHNVVPDIRALPLGDVLWVAKIKAPHDSEFKFRNSGDEEEGSTEVVLEHVVERKRLDDLIGSIKDGRFHEQKFRLRKSGMRHVTYLIEDYSVSVERSEKYGEAVESAIAGMQVVSDIFVKQTAKIDDTIRYLARMTQTLKDLYEQKDLYVLPSRTLDASTYLSTMNKLRSERPDRPYCITFSAFCSMCDKSDSMTLRDVYLKMLMCTRGVTGDKAIEIQKIWNTPRALIEAYENAGPRKANLISDKMGDKIPRKKIGKALSAKIAEVWAG